MIYTLDEIAQRIQPVAEQYKLKAVYVFGSYARGEAREDSDVDLLIDDTGSGLRGFAYGGLYADLEDALEKKIVEESSQVKEFFAHPDTERAQEFLKTFDYE